MRKDITDTSTMFGIIAALGLVGVAIYLGSIEGNGSPFGFVDIKSIFIVVGGTLFLVIACFSVRDVLKTLSAIPKTMLSYSEDPKQAALTVLELSNIARKDGILGLQRHGKLLQHSTFLEQCVTMIIDGIPVEEADQVMRKEIDSVLHGHEMNTRILHKGADIAPAMGLIGTLIGLVLMLGNLGDPESIGPSMAVALLTTLYGAILSYMILTPLATKLERNTRSDAKIMYIYLSAMVSIGKKENPRRLEMLINATLSPSQRVDYFS